jgi:hypothetical protein
MTRTVVIALLAAGLLTACGESKPPATSAPSADSTQSSSSTPPQTSAPTATTPTKPPTPEKKYLLELEAKGTARITLLTFTMDGKTTQQKSVKLPWRKAVDVPAGNHEWKLTMKYGNGTVFAVSKVDGQVLTQTAGSSSGGSSNSSAELSGSFSK